MSKAPTIAEEDVPDDDADEEVAEAEADEEPVEDDERIDTGELLDDFGSSGDDEAESDAESDSDTEDDEEEDLDLADADDLFGGGSGGSTADEDDEDDLSIAESLNAGYGTVGVFGLEHEDRDEYKNEFQELAAEMQLGKHSERVIKRQLLSDDGEMTPEEMLAISLSLYCITVWAQRPDSDELVSNAADKIKRDSDDD